MSRKPKARSEAESALIWEDADGNLDQAPTGARAARTVRLGDGVAAVTVDDSRDGAAVVAAHPDAWRVERPDGTVTMLVRYSGPGYRTRGLTVQTTGTADVGGARRIDGGLPDFRRPW